MFLSLASGSLDACVKSQGSKHRQFRHTIRNVMKSRKVRPFLDLDSRVLYRRKCNSFLPLPPFLIFIEDGHRSPHANEAVRIRAQFFAAIFYIGSHGPLTTCHCSNSSTVILFSTPSGFNCQKKPLSIVRKIRLIETLKNVARESKPVTNGSSDLFEFHDQASSRDISQGHVSCLFCMLLASGGVTTIQRE